MGLDETKKLVNALKNDVIELLSVDYEKVGDELAELDANEKKELLILVGGAVIDILASVKIGPLAVVKLLGGFKRV